MTSIYDNILDSSSQGSRGERLYDLKPLSVKEFFNSAPKKTIPDYQRPYAWEAGNITDLWNDIHKVAQSGQGWFMGTVFTVRDNQNGEPINYLLDGQQRVTTFQIILNEIATVKLRFESFDWESHRKLESELNRLVSACKECLFDLSGSEIQLRFETEPVSRQLLKDFFLSSSEIHSLDELVSHRKQFDAEADKKREEGSKTAGRLRLAVGQIEERIQTLVGKGQSRQVEEVIAFGKALLYRLWLIQVPLRDDESTTQIFEGLNNRGRTLSLVSKLRFKCLLHAGEEINSIRDSWKEIYEGLEFIEDAGFIKSEDDFFKVFINSIAGSNHTSERDLVEYFTAHCIFGVDIDGQEVSRGNANPASIVKTLKKVRGIQTFFKILDENLSSRPRYLSSFNGTNHHSVQALFEVLKRCINFSDNSRFLLFNALQEYDWQGQEKDAFIERVWDIIRCVIVTEIIEELKSNDTRTRYLKVIKANEEESLQEYSAKAATLGERSVIGLMRSTDNNRAKFILATYALFKDVTSLIRFSPAQVRKSHLDHLWPRAFKSDWSPESTYEKPDVLAFLGEIDFSDYPLLNHEQLSKMIDSMDEMALKEYTTRPYKQPNSLIEWIGNKWVLHAGTNITSSNGPFASKKTLYQDESIVKIPSNELPEVGINSFEKFDFQSVIKRSVRIVHDIVSGLSARVKFLD